jgi:hypothetical protein
MQGDAPWEQPWIAATDGDRNAGRFTKRGPVHETRAGSRSKKPWIAATADLHSQSREHGRTQHEDSNSKRNSSRDSLERNAAAEFH